MKFGLLLVAGAAALGAWSASPAAAANATAVPLTPYAISTPAAGVFGGASVDVGNEIDSATALDADSAIVDDDIAGGAGVDRGLGVGAANNPPHAGPGHAK